MERWTLTKLEFLAWWGVPMLWAGVPVVVVALLLNWLTGRAIEGFLVVIGTFILTVVGTASAIWILMWADVR